MDQAEQIGNLVAENLSPDKFVVEIVVSGKKVPKKVVIVIDGDQGVTIDDCADLSRVLSKEFDARAFFRDDNYLLEVSTPGLDQPLKLKRQFFKNKGRKLKVISAEGPVEGELTEVTDEKLVLIQERGAGKKKETAVVEILFSEIDKAFVLASFK